MGSIEGRVAKTLNGMLIASSDVAEIALDKVQLQRRFKFACSVGML